ncbi:MAG: YHS domain-containing (seleno)protein, partial [Thermosynechococcaceae cyanobacterium]
MNYNVTLLSVVLVLGIGLSTGCTNPSTSSDTERIKEIQSSGKPMTFAENGIAIRGYDPVAYFTESQPVQGKSEFAYDWKGATWHFASAEHRDLFSGEPAKYAPQYGGYCAWAVKEGTTAPIDPQAWKIVDGKLYL